MPLEMMSWLNYRTPKFLTQKEAKDDLSDKIIEWLSAVPAAHSVYVRYPVTVVEIRDFEDDGPRWVGRVRLTAFKHMEVPLAVYGGEDLVAYPPVTHNNVS